MAERRRPTMIGRGADAFLTPPAEAATVRPVVRDAPDNPYGDDTLIYRQKTNGWVKKVTFYLTPEQIQIMRDHLHQRNRGLRGEKVDQSDLIGELLEKLRS